MEYLVIMLQEWISENFAGALDADISATTGDFEDVITIRIKKF